MEADAGSSDTLNSGGYDTATTGKLTDLTTTANTGNTSAPVLKSATYNFVAADIGNWVYISTSGGASGWIAGWYKVTAVSSNQATVNAAIGAAVLSNFTANTAVGVATTATPTAATASVDYSQVPAVVFSLTGLTTAAANAIILTASATKAMVGNLIQITGGTNFTTGFYVIQACTAGVSLTVDRNCTTAAGAIGTAGIGGALASPGKMAALMVGGNKSFIKAGTYSITSASTNVSGGCLDCNFTSLSLAASSCLISGYQTLRGDNGTHPLLQASGISTATIATVYNYTTWRYVDVDGATLTSITGIVSRVNSQITFSKIVNCTNGGVIQGGQSPGRMSFCEVGTCTTAYAVNGLTAVYGCYIHDNTAGGITAVLTVGYTLLINNTRSAAPVNSLPNAEVYGCVFYGSNKDGCDPSQASSSRFVNCIFYNNSLFGLLDNGATKSIIVANCAFGANNSGASATAFPNLNYFNNVNLTSDPFVNAAGGNFALTPLAISLLNGIPGVYPGLASTTAFTYIGAVQPQARMYNPIGSSIIQSIQEGVLA